MDRSEATMRAHVAAGAGDSPVAKPRVEAGVGSEIRAEDLLLIERRVTALAAAMGSGQRQRTFDQLPSKTWGMRAGV
ncbi:MAG: hypothetical protein V3S83_00620 [Gemmatimonadota bacterium]